MIVTCIGTETPGDTHTAESWLTIGREYVVLSVAMVPGLRPVYRLLTDEAGSEGLFDVRMFEVVDPTPSRRWTVNTSSNGTVELGPRVWAAPSFWETFYDDFSGARGVGPGDDSARNAFWAEVDVLYAEHGLPPPPQA